MAKSEVEEVTRKTMQRGGILAKLYFDMQSEKEEDLQPLLTELINNNLMKTDGVVYAYGSIESPIKVDKFFSSSAEVVMLTKDLGTLVNISFRYAPAALEILKPDNEYIIKVADLQSILLGLAQTSIEYSQFILSKTLKKEDYEKIQQDIRNREALGKKLLEKKGEKAS